jgi:hypothetical protein
MVPEDTMPTDFFLPLIDPTAPVPAYWPTGFWGAFLLFLVWGGAGIPMGVLMGREAGLSPTMMTGMYFVSDIVMAIIHEPLFWLLGWLASTVPTIGKMRTFFRQVSRSAGLQDKGAHGPLGLILFSFTVDPISGRGAAATAGHGFFMGWTFAIAGDMVYFAVLMGATLWLSGLFGDERLTVGVVLLAVWGFSMWIRRRQQGTSAPPLRRPRPAPSLTPAPAAVATNAYLHARPAPEGSSPSSPHRSPRKKAGRKRRPR